jgi:hypothetical protein
MQHTLLVRNVVRHNGLLCLLLLHCAENLLFALMLGYCCHAFTVLPALYMDELQERSHVKLAANPPAGYTSGVSLGCCLRRSPSAC